MHSSKQKLIAVRQLFSELPKILWNRRITFRLIKAFTCNFLSHLKIWNQKKSKANNFILLLSRSTLDVDKDNQRTYNYSFHYVQEIKCQNRLQFSLHGFKHKSRNLTPITEKTNALFSDLVFLRLASKARNILALLSSSKFKDIQYYIRVYMTVNINATNQHIKLVKG